MVSTPSDVPDEDDDVLFFYKRNVLSSHGTVARTLDRTHRRAVSAGPIIAKIPLACDAVGWNYRCSMPDSCEKKVRWAPV